MSPMVVLSKANLTTTLYFQDSIYHHLLGLSLEFMKPVGFGILTVKNYDQALARAVGPKARGAEALEAVHKLLS